MLGNTSLAEKDRLIFKSYFYIESPLKPFRKLRKKMVKVTMSHAKKRMLKIFTSSRYKLVDWDETVNKIHTHTHARTHAPDLQGNWRILLQGSKIV